MAESLLGWMSENERCRGSRRDGKMDFVGERRVRVCVYGIWRCWFFVVFVVVVEVFLQTSSSRSVYSKSYMMGAVRDQSGSPSRRERCSFCLGRRRGGARVAGATEESETPGRQEPARTKQHSCLPPNGTQNGHTNANPPSSQPVDDDSTSLAFPPSFHLPFSIFLPRPSRFAHKEKSSFLFLLRYTPTHQHPKNHTHHLNRSDRP